MASDYGLNFGFRRSDETLAVREGRFKSPKTALVLQGQLVMLDAAEPGHLKLAPTNTAPVTGLVGLAVQEEDHLGSVFAAAPGLGHDSLDLGPLKKAAPTVMWSGVGTKVWFKNTSSYSRAGRTKGAVTMLDLTGVAVGDSLAWDGAKYVKSGTDLPALMTVTHLASGYAEAVLTF